MGKSLVVASTDGRRIAHRARSKKSDYPPIDDYAFISDCHASALISKAGSIDWCCMPRFDSAPVFGRLLDWRNGGACSIAPRQPSSASRRYLDGTLVHSTVFDTAGGEAEVLDCFTTHEGGAQNPYRQLLRIIEGRRGRTDLHIDIEPRFDYAGVRPWIRHHGPHLYSAIGGNDALAISCDKPLSVTDEHNLVADVTVRAGERVRLVIQSVRPEQIDPSPPPAPDADELDRRLRETIEWWRRWSSKCNLGGPYGPGAKLSAVVLKGLTHAPTGAVVAAPTTSLPEAIGHERNWDYRYSWIRDSHFTVRALADLGFHAEADGFRRFIERAAAASVESLQIMYGVGGERRLTEILLDDLDGYARSRPVRVGNAAAGQLQLDVYGELLDLAWRWHERGSSPDDDYWRFLVSVVDFVADNWDRPDLGLWELRGRPRHHVHSKAMCWVALDRGIRLARDCLRRAPEKRWRAARDAVRRALDRRGFNRSINSFVQSFGSRQVDAALLLLPAFDVVPYDDPRMIGTVDAIREQLDDRGLIRRYKNADSLSGQEGTFLACSFWLVDCLAHQGRLTEAREAFDRALAAANDVGLFAEEYDPTHERSLGNFPQALTHLSHITAAVALTHAAAGDSDNSPSPTPNERSRSHA